MLRAMESKVDYVLGERLPEPLRPIEIADGILWIRLPMPIALNHINLYLLDDGDSWTLVDTGLADPASRATWEALLSGVLSDRPIATIIGTHFHPDHVGMAGWLQARFDCTFWMSQLEWLQARNAYLDTEDQASERMARFYQLVGLRPDEITAYRDLGNDYRQLVTPIPATYNRITRATNFRIGGRTWQPIFGSGHSPDHVALYCPDDRILLGGDLLLPRITPVISVWWQEPDSDPLADYLAFLGTLGHVVDDVLVLPAHNRPYRELRTRVRDLGQHHHERLEQTLDRCQTPATAREIMDTLFLRKMDVFETRFAIGETVAHVNNLLYKGELLRELDDSTRYLYQRAA